MSLIDTLENFYHYKLVSAANLLRRGEFGYLIGATVETVIGWNPYVGFRHRRGKEMIVERRIMDHRMALNLSDPGISRRLFMRRVHEPDATQAYLRSLETTIDGEEDIILDIGANIGYYALLEAQLLGDDGRVIAFEPHPDNRELLERNIRLNNYQDVIKVDPAAVGAKVGKSKLRVAAQSNLHRIDQTAGDGGGAIDVDLVSIDSYLTDQDIQPNSIAGVRMDLEGHETTVLKGMESLSAANTPLTLFIEFHPERIGEIEFSEVLDRLQQAGFGVEFVGQNRQTFEVETLQEVSTIGGSHVRVVLRR